MIKERQWLITSMSFSYLRTNYLKIKIAREHIFYISIAATTFVYKGKRLLLSTIYEMPATAVSIVLLAA